MSSSLQKDQCLAVYDAALLGNAFRLPEISSFIGVLDGNMKLHKVSDAKKLAQNNPIHREPKRTTRLYRKK